MFGTLIFDCVKINTMYVLLIDVIGHDFENRRRGTAFASHAGDRGSISGRDRPKS